MKKLFFVVIFMIFAITGCNSEETAVYSVKIFADSSLTEALNDVIETYREENPVNIEIISGSTSSLYSRITAGADCDIFIPSSKEQINSLVKAGLLEEENATIILENEVVLIKKLGSSLTLKSFDAVTEAKSIALAKESEPVGAFAREIFINLGVFKDVLKMNTSNYDDSPSVVNAVINGKCDVGVCFETDALAQADKVQIIASEPKDSLNSEAVYSVAVLNGSDGSAPSEDAEDIAEFLDSPEAAKIFAGYNFGIYIG